MNLSDIQRKILQVVDEKQGNSSSYVDAAAIAGEIDVDLNEIHGHLDLLEEADRIRLSKTMHGTDAFLTSKHRILLRDEEARSSVDASSEDRSPQIYPAPNSDTRTLTGLLLLDGKIKWQLFHPEESMEIKGIQVQFPVTGSVSRRDAVRIVEEHIKKNDIEWLARRTTKKWALHLSLLQEEMPDFLNRLEWAKGNVTVEPEIQHTASQYPSGEAVIPVQRTIIRFAVEKEDVVLSQQQKIFLSHKGADKPLVREFFHTLKTIGFDPWLDEDAMTAGTELERGILQGYKDSCAAVFFITPNFKDEGYLATEVNYAIAEKRDKGDRFAIITIVFTGKKKEKGTVPELLKQYVWKEPGSELEAVREIIRALPIETGETRWRDGVNLDAK